jgi:hypothetical protein
MQILFAISIVCFIALVWAGVGIARHIYRGHKGERARAYAHGDFAHYLFAAAENREVRQPRAVAPQTVRDVSARKGWNSGPASVEIHPNTRQEGAAVPEEGSMQGRRKMPEASHKGTGERLDWAYFNKDAGDLTDPYQNRRFRNNSGVRAI